jgi:hypothetical protein
MAKIKIGIIGVGNISECHIAGYKCSPDAELYAFCDINEERLKEKGARRIFAFATFGLFTDGLENFFSLFYLGKIESRALEHLKANLEKENEDVFEDASIADSYNIKDDDNVIRVDIIPNDGKSKEEPAKEKQDSPAAQAAEEPAAHFHHALGGCGYRCG